MHDSTVCSFGTAHVLPLPPCTAGAEVIRLYEAVLGKQGFRKGMDLYFKRHDGQVWAGRCVRCVRCGTGCAGAG